MYKHAAEDEGGPDLFEERNKLFHDPEADKRQQLLMNRTEDGSLPEISDSVVKIARILQRDVLKAFNAHGANINAENDSSLRPLQSACSWSELELVEILLGSGISDINDSDLDGLTALHTAASTGSTACVRLLISHNANMGLESKDGRTALHIAAQNGH